MRPKGWSISAQTISRAHLTTFRSNLADYLGNFDFNRHRVKFPYLPGIPPSGVRCWRTPNYRLVEQLVRLSQTLPGMVFIPSYQNLDSYDS
jgi:hypothetical protein